MLSWTVLVLAPVSVIIAVAARPLATLLLAGAPRCAHAAIVGVSTRMLVVFAPQILLTGWPWCCTDPAGAPAVHRARARARLSSVVVILRLPRVRPLSQGYGCWPGCPGPPS